MKATITLELKTREVNQLFERKINGDRLFMDALLHKLNKITRQCKKGVPGTEDPYQSIQQALQTLTHFLADETNSLLTLVQKNLFLKNKTIAFETQFFPKLKVESVLALEFIKCIEEYDKLITTFKLLHLVGGFESTQAYYANSKRIQKMVNRSLSKIIVDL